MISATVMAGLSSTRISVWLSAEEAMESLLQSSSSRWPVVSFWFSTKLSVDKRRMTSCSRDISSEKKATVFSYVFATFRQMLSAIAVLPMPGRAAIRIRSVLLRPLILRSRSCRPVDRPGISLPEAASSSSRS